jgi:hypothetical protein
LRRFDAPLVTLTPAFLAGADDTTHLQSVGGGSLTPDGGIVVADTSARVVRGFTREGTATFMVGGRGIGPGQFERIAGIAVSPDTVFVFDDGLWRITAFDLTGVLIFTRRVQSRPPSVLPARVARSADGTWLLLDQQAPDIRAMTTGAVGPQRAVARLVRWSTEQSVWLPVGEWPGTELYLAEDSADVSSPQAMPFARGPLWAVDRTGGFWMAQNDVWAASHHASNGDTVARVAYAGEGARITDEERRDRVREYERLPGADADARERVAIPPSWPALHALLTSHSGELWVATNAGPRDTVEWQALDVLGGPRLRLRLPRRLAVLDAAGDTLLVAGRDASGRFVAGRHVLATRISSTKWQPLCSPRVARRSLSGSACLSAPGMAISPT